MKEADIRFEAENLTGVMPVGSYLKDAANRLGIRFEPACDLAEQKHSCSVSIVHGNKLLSDRTEEEHKVLAEESDNDRRLACQCRIEKAGEVVVMTDPKKDSEKSEKPEEISPEEYRKQFAALPLEKKIGEIVHLEMMTLNETLTYVANSPYTVADKVLDIMAGFGFSKEKKAKEESIPKEHRTDAAAADASSETDDLPDLDEPVDAQPIDTKENGQAA